MYIATQLDGSWALEGFFVADSCAFIFLAIVFVLGCLFDEREITDARPYARGPGSR